MKKVLIILFYWPPSGGSSVQRWLHFSNYLPEHGWEPIIYAPEDAQYPETDLTLEQRIGPRTRVIRRSIFEPYGMYRKFAGIKKEENLAAGMTIQEAPGRLSKIKNTISVWIRGNFFIPDARMFWIKPSVRFLKKFLAKEKVDAIITTGPPHSLHLIGFHLNKSTGVPWLADFRDPWTNIDFYSDLKLTWLADRYHHHLERKVLHKADQVIVVGQEMKREFTDMGIENVTVITNGYDEEDLPPERPALDTGFSLLHIGTFSRSRNSEAFWRAVQKLREEDDRFASDLEIKLAGNVDHSVMKSIREHGLQTCVNPIDYLSHADAMKAIHSAQVLLLFINRSKNARGILTGKFFEYLASGRPILLIGPVDGDAARLLRETRSGREAGFDDTEAIYGILKEYYRCFQEGKLHVSGQGIEGYSRRKLTEKLAGLLEKVTASAG